MVRFNYSRNLAPLNKAKRQAWLSACSFNVVRWHLYHSTPCAVTAAVTQNRAVCVVNPNTSTASGLVFEDAPTHAKSFLCSSSGPSISNGTWHDRKTPLETSGVRRRQWLIVQFPAQPPWNAKLHANIVNESELSKTATAKHRATTPKKHINPGIKQQQKSNKEKHVGQWRHLCSEQTGC